MEGSDNTARMTAILIGYAIATLQILLIDWVRVRWKHQRQLRYLGAELRRAREFDRRYGLSKGKLPTSDQVPKPPALSSNYAAAVAATDFYLTDEHDDDNTQQGRVAGSFVVIPAQVDSAYDQN